MHDPARKVDLSNCDREPIHILGAIQPFGFLLALTGDWRIARVSANTEAFIGRTPESLLNEPLLGVLTAEAIHLLRNRLQLMHGADAVERLFGVDLLGQADKLFDVVLHFSHGQVVIEAEPAQADRSSSASGLRSMMMRLDQAATMQAFFQEGARQVRALTGFDRVMIYRFDEKGSGEVIAEATRSGIGSFLGLHYPATDIPAQARVLYLRNLFRIIADISAPAVPIIPALDEAGVPLDLSLAVTRAVSSIHIEYLTNMGVGASLSISIVIDGRLWGLFVCHHYGTRLPSLERRTLTELFGQLFSAKLESRERQALADYLQVSRAVSDELLAAVAKDAKRAVQADVLGETLRRAIACDGVAVSLHGRVLLSGQTPDEREFQALMRRLDGPASGGIYATDCIGELAPGVLASAGSVAGMLLIPISLTPGECVVLFRQEYLREVHWAGDPHKPAEYGVNGPRLTPRKSFEAWAETVQGRSRPFTPAEVRVAEMLRTTLIEVVLRISEEAHAERQLATDRQEILIAELNHRVRNILSLIRALVQRSRTHAGSIEDYVRETDNRITALARAHDQITDDHWGPAPLRALIATEADAYIGAKASQVLVQGPEVLLAPQAFSTMALVVHELMTNSVKYGGLADSGRVHVQWQLDAAGVLAIEWREEGGPAVKVPTHQGFGSTIIRRSIPYDLGGSVEIDYAPSGFIARFSIPARHVSERAVAAGEQLVIEPSATTRGSLPLVLAGLTVLLVEDSLIIALDAEDSVLQLGAKKVVSSAGVVQALEEIARERPDIALLDINLGSENSFPVAEQLHALGVPFFFTTGYGERHKLPPSLIGSRVLQKPYTVDGIARFAAELLSATG